MKKAIFSGGFLILLVAAGWILSDLDLALRLNSRVFPLVDCPAPPPEDSPWTCFQYNNTGKGVMYLPLRLDGWEQTLWMQVDLGAPRTMLYEKPLQQINPLLNPPVEPAGPLSVGPSITVDTVRLHGWLGNSRLQNTRVSLRKNYGQQLGFFDYPKVGSVGLDFYKDKVLVIDFPRQWLAVFDDPEEIPPDLLQRAKWVEARLEEDKLIFPASIGGREMEMFYDTGGGKFPIITTKAIWQQLTGRSGDEEDNTRVETKSWGEAVRYVGAPALGSLAIGEMTLGVPTIYYYDGSQHDWLDLANYPVPAMMGNNLFVERHTLIFDLIDMRLGIAENP